MDGSDRIAIRRRGWAAGLWAALAGMASFADPAAAQSQCTQLSIPTIALGTYTGSVSTAGTVTGNVTCPNFLSYILGISQGAGLGATTANRKLTSGSATLTYQLFQNSALTINWDDIGGAGDLNGTGSGTTQHFSAYPRIPAGQLSPPGTYTDTITTSVRRSGTSTFISTVTATILPTCTFTTNILAFGNYIGVALNATATLAVTCTNTTTYQLGINTGLHGSGANFNWNMAGPGGALANYSLYRDAARTQLWGGTIGAGGDTINGTGSGVAQSITFYGAVPAGQHVTPGLYTDTVNVTLYY